MPAMLAAQQRPLLIDSGSDETILPNMILENLGPGLLRKTREVEDFNGNRYFLKSILLDMSHFGINFERTFYPILTNGDDYGLLGRDVLNQVHIELNGIKLEWKVKGTFI